MCTNLHAYDLDLDLMTLIMKLDIDIVKMFLHRKMKLTDFLPYTL